MAAEGDPLIQMDMMRDILDERLGRTPGTGLRFEPKAIPQEDLEALAAEERRRVRVTGCFRRVITRIIGCMLLCCGVFQTSSSPVLDLGCSS